MIDDADAVHDMQLRFYVERNAALVIYLLIADNNARIKIDSLLRGEGAQVHVKGAYILSGEHAVSIDTFQHHQAAHTSSTLVMKGALRGKSHAHYCGTIRVERCAQGTYASQENKNMLLSNNARAISVPNLEVLNNDVKCFHGSAIGRFDDEQLFYAGTRGINQAIAQQLLLKAFFADLFVDDELNEKVLELIK